MRKPDFAGAQWFKSTRSQTQNACVEAAHVPGFVGVRDTKDRAAGYLAVESSEWVAFVDAIKENKFDQ